MGHILTKAMEKSCFFSIPADAGCVCRFGWLRDRMRIR